MRYSNFSNYTVVNGKEYATVSVHPIFSESRQIGVYKADDIWWRFINTGMNCPAEIELLAHAYKARAYLYAHDISAYERIYDT